MAGIFDPIEINGMTVSNRIVRSATYEGRAAPDGSVTERLIEMISELARGGVGLIITGYAFVHPRGRGTPFQTAIDRDELIPGLKEMVERVHEHGSRIVIQLVHCGRQTKPEFIRGQTPLAPSAVREPVLGVEPSAMTREEIEEVEEAFVRAAVRAKEAGFDGVQIHGAHGYLLSSFLSPHTNRRNDEYGGSPEGRLRIVLEILSKIREEVGEDYPVMIKMNVDDFLEGGVTVDDVRYYVGELSAAGINAIELSGSMFEANRRASLKGINSREKEAYFLPYVERVKDAAGGVPIILVGGMRSPDLLEEILQQEKAEMISMSRPLIREPHLVNVWKDGVMKRADCISCNKCLSEAYTGETRCHQI